ncbi:hypothetical protein GCM10010387_36500 [Streptomyces inusitatus]|uniref:Uncharacterized protein n=1 Tax=Streptomyces inusitatus TaxID=68221 RepID=A0A918QBH5_9ACTN|nr:hypothetical protein GCM10010387_36500 [Streptomyces inusitatus]
MARVATQWGPVVARGGWAAAAGAGISRTLAHAAAVSPVTAVLMFMFFLISVWGGGCCPGPAGAAVRVFTR